MNEIPYVSFLGGDVTLFCLLAAALCLLAGAGMIYLWRKKGRGVRAAALFCAGSALRGLLLGRAVYCAVRFDSIFYDEMGDYAGLSRFFTMETGGLNVLGILAGCLLTAWIVSKVTGDRPGELLDAAALPGLLLFAAIRLIEPLSGQGYGMLIEQGALQWAPLSIDNGWGTWSLSVCFIEAVLLLVSALLVWRLPVKRPGARAMLALALIAGLQIVPETLRQDDVLWILIFAPLTQIGYAVLLFGTLFAALRGFPRKTALRELGLLLAGIALLTGDEFALDKSDWPHLLIYAGMIAVSAAMTGMTVRRILIRDRQAPAAV